MKNISYSNPLEVLELPVGSSIHDAKKRMRALALKFHPDHNPDNPDAEQKFLDIKEAYEAIEANPQILNGIQPPVQGFRSFLKITIPVTIRDFYLGNEIRIPIERHIFCSKCAGTGSDTRLPCSHCNGVGEIKNSVQSLLKIDSICPVCSGTGVPPNGACSKCNGSRYELDRSVRKIQLSIDHYRQKVIVLKQAGNQTSSDTYAHAYIKFDVKFEDHVRIEEDHFLVFQRVLPVQRIIGDQGILDMYGRRIPYRIDRNATEVFVTDSVKPGVLQKIRIKFIEEWPVITPQTMDLYKQILEIEKVISV